MNFSQAHQAASRGNLAFRGILVGLVFALGLVFLAPAFDHHFAERQHDHSHVFLTASATSQVHPDIHPFEQSHSHLELGEEAPEGDGVLYQTSNAIFGEFGSVFSVFINDGLTYAIPSHDMLSFAMTAGESNHPENSLAPPTRPPLA